MINIQIRSFANDQTDEDQAAFWFKERLMEDLSQFPNAKGNIYILTSIRIFGQKRNDIDLLVIGFIDNFIIRGTNTKNCGVIDKLSIKSFICNIELKSHPAGSVRREGTNYIVLYKGVPHNASQQCMEAKYSLFNHLNDQLDIKPFICDALWFNGLSFDDLNHMRGSSLDNALWSDFHFRNLLDVILLQAEVKSDPDGRYLLDCFYNGEKEYQSIVDLFTRKREPKGLTRKKFELLSQKDSDVAKLLLEAGKKLTIVTGRAGTGKTVQLLQLAFQLASESLGGRCMILTYNNALVSDIQRLIDYTPMPSRVDGRIVSIRTIDSFFLLLMNEAEVLKEKLNPKAANYNHRYEYYLHELYLYVVGLCEKKDITAIKDLPNSQIDWDYILIDEAQDFTTKEKEILFKIYGANRIIVADGIDQFMRSSQRQKWHEKMDKNLIYKPKEMTLERRQKANLVTFVNAFAKEVNIDWEVRPNKALAGGEIKIYKGYNSNIHSALKTKCNKDGCENYDILILVPPTLVVHDENGTYFKNAVNYKKANIDIYDGTNPDNRTSYPTKDECRLYLYHSCRGLEGWCVVCDRFDELISYLLEHTDIPEDTLGLDSDIQKWRIVMLWALMPLTRPIDTLVITLKDPKSKIGQILKTLSSKYKDFIEWNINN